MTRKHDMENKKISPRIIRTLIFSVVLGLLLTCGSIIVVGKKAHFSHCDYSGRSTNTVDRGTPITYFKVTPSESTCVNVDYTSAVFASDVGNDISLKAFMADWLIWSGISVIVILAMRKIRASKNTTPHIPVDDLK
jgi:hypothetical protein